MWEHFLLLCRGVADCRDRVKDDSGSQNILYVQLEML